MTYYATLYAERRQLRETLYLLNRIADQLLADADSKTLSTIDALRMRVYYELTDVLTAIEN